MLDNLKKYNIVLASKSPRRCELLRGMGIDFEVMTKDIAEVVPPSIATDDVAEYLSMLKSNAFTQHELPPHFLLIAADTVVINDNHILGKPHTHAEACAMLASLSGKQHSVVTGVTVRSASVCRSFAARSEVTFEKLTSEMINHYVDHYRPYDKAGSYGIQEWIGYVAISSIEGSFYNVMGLPTQKLFKTLCNF